MDVMVVVVALFMVGCGGVGPLSTSSTVDALCPHIVLTRSQISFLFRKRRQQDGMEEKTKEKVNQPAVLQYKYIVITMSIYI